MNYTCPVPTSDPIVAQEIADIQRQIDNAIANHLNMVRIDNTYMTDIHYNDQPSSDLEAKLNQEIEDRKLADSAIMDQLNAEIAAREQGDQETLANIQMLIDAEAQARQEADANLQSQIDNISGVSEEEIRRIVQEEIQPIKDQVAQLMQQIETAKIDCMEAWKREQARAMSVEENLQEQIYLMGEGAYIRKDMPIAFQSIVLPSDITIDDYEGGFLRQDEPIGFTESLDGESTIQINI